MTQIPDEMLRSMTQLYYSREREAARLRAARVFVVNGSMSGTSFELGDGPVSIGRRPENQVCLPLQQISKKHCSIGPDEHGGYFLRDERSTNGTVVNGRRLEPGAKTTLAHGDKILLCDTVLLFVNPRGSADAAKIAEISIDRDAVAKEVDDVLAGIGELVNLGRNRRR